MIMTAFKIDPPRTRLMEKISLRDSDMREEYSGRICETYYLHSKPFEKINFERNLGVSGGVCFGETRRGIIRWFAVLVLVQGGRFYDNC